MNPSISQEINLLREILNQQNDFGIVIGSHQNLDTYACALSLYASLTQAGKKVQVISRKAPTVEVSNLVGIDKVRDSFSAGNTSKLVISLPYIKGEVEKVLFTEFPNPQNPTNINFHLTAAEGKSITPFDLKDVRLIWEGGAPSTIISVGVSSLDELNGIDQGAKIINIDNYQGNSRFGDVVLVDDAFSSLSEISGKIIKDLNLPLDIDAAQNVLDGVLFATRNFTKSNTSPLAFEAASTAMYMGARRSDEGKETSSFPQRQSQRSERQRDRDQGENVRETDFPASHMQGQRGQQTQDDRRSRGQRGGQSRQTQRQFGQDPRSQFGKNPSDIDELMKKINEENARRQGGGQQFGGQNRQSQRQQQHVQPQQPAQDDVYDPTPEDTKIVNEPPMNAPIQDAQMPEEAIYQAPDPQDVPDDWLMPKVFKSSKNN
jgi:hypothetical protein